MEWRTLLMGALPAGRVGNSATLYRLCRHADSTGLCCGARPSRSVPLTGPASAYRTQAISVRHQPATLALDSSTRPSLVTLNPSLPPAALRRILHRLSVHPPAVSLPLTPCMPAVAVVATSAITPSTALSGWAHIDQ